MIAELSRSVKDLVNYASKNFGSDKIVSPYVRTNVPSLHVTESEVSHLLTWRDLQSVLNLILDSHVMVMQLTSVKRVTADQCHMTVSRAQLYNSFRWRALNF